jgi:hypothetical protein
MLGKVLIKGGALTDVVLHWNNQTAECQKKIMMASNINVHGQRSPIDIRQP